MGKGAVGIDPQDSQLSEHGFLSEEAVVRMTNGYLGEMAVVNITLTMLQPFPPGTC